MAYKCHFCHIAFPFGDKHLIFNDVVDSFLQGVAIENIKTRMDAGNFHHSTDEVEKILREEMRRLHKKQSHKAFWKEKDGK